LGSKGGKAFTAPKSIPASFRRNQLAKRSWKAHSLNTAFEWLADERENNQKAYSCLSWIDVAAALTPDRDEVSSAAHVEMPLYPIGATYLPSNTTHYLNNMEPRNVQMALDLARLPMARRFCVVLRASDTGRVASVGTVMFVMDVSIQRMEGGDIRKVQVTCRPEATVDILSIVNPQAASPENLIRKTPEYLTALVKYRSDMTVIKGENDDAIVESMLCDYNAIRNLYLSGRGSGNLPPYAINNLRDALPEWIASDLDSDNGNFWVSLEQWQTLCNTVRENQQMTLSADCNEIMVAAASAKGGPLKLPIYIYDLPPLVRGQLQQLEVKAQKDFISMGLDPCLDFQVMLSLPNYTEKIQFFASMISRERARLERVGETEEFVTPNVSTSGQEQTRRGAWFDDSLWTVPPASLSEVEEVEEIELSGDNTFNVTSPIAGVQN
jgi:hypothetical protein